MVDRLDPDLQDPVARPRRHRRHARPREEGGHRRARLPPLRPRGGRPLREDGPQRHRVRPDGRLRRRASTSSATPTSARHGSHEKDAETTPLRNPEHFQYDFDLADITELWRRGSVVTSWLLDLTAQALAADPGLDEFGGKVSDSGEGRWTVQAANDEGVPAHVLTAALFERFASRGQDLLPEQGPVGHAQGLRRPRREEMKEDRPPSDALVFFGATGDLAYKKIFPALQALARRGKLDCPVIGVAKSGWSREQFVERARASLNEHGAGVDEEAFARLARNAPLRRRGLQRSRDLRAPARGARRRPSAPPTTWPFPPACSRWWSKNLAAAGCADAGPGDRGEAVRPRPRLGAGARTRPCTRSFPRRASSASTTTSARRRCRTSCTSASPTPSSSRS